MTKTQRRAGSAGAQHGGRGLRHAALGLAAALAAVALVGAPPSGDEALAADLLGHDVS